MITIKKDLNLAIPYPLERIGPLADLVFFDIETTGFSGDYASLYLIGSAYYQDSSWRLIQWFADTRDSEKDLLEAFFTFLKRFRILLHFNGDGFDIPFLLKRCRHYGLDWNFSSVKSIDIYKKIRPYRKLLGLNSLKQKAIEDFLGIVRTDQYSGGQLIACYEEYLVTRNQHLYDLLILHNEDDLKGMPLILPILNYSDFLEHPFSLLCQQVLDASKALDVADTPNAVDISDTASASGTCRHQLKLTCQSDYSVPAAFRAASSLVSLEARDNQMDISINLYDGTLKHFYPNYKDYYYLIYEDAAIHKSIGEFVDKSARIKATAKTCYTKKEGCFVPQFQPLWKPAMKQEPKDKLSYAALSDVCLHDPACLQAYIKQLLAHLGTMR